MTDLDFTALETEVQDVLSTASTGAITTPAEALRAAEDINLATAQENRVDEVLDPPIKSANQTHKWLTGLRSKLKAPITAYKNDRKAALAVFHEAQERARREEEARLQEAARKRAEEEALETAIAAEAAGDKEAAQEILAAPILAPVVQIQAQKIEGVSFRRNRSAEVYDLDLFFDALGKGLIPRGAVTINQTWLNNQARALGDEMRYPGVRAVTTTTVASQATGK